jgi:hypothetical protein
MGPYPVPPIDVPIENMSNYDTYVLAYYLATIAAGGIPPINVANLNQEVTQLAFKSANHADLSNLATFINAVTTAVNNFKTANHTDLGAINTNLTTLNATELISKTALVGAFRTSAINVVERVQETTSLACGIAVNAILLSAPDRAIKNISFLFDSTPLAAKPWVAFVTLD